MKQKMKKTLTLLMIFCMTMGTLCSPAFGMSNTPYWETSREVNGATQTITHAVLDSNGNLVNIGAESGALGAGSLEPGTMTAQKFGAFEDADDAANGIVKLTFDVVGKPIEVPGPLDVLIIADESGSMNMYGRSEQSNQLKDYDNKAPQNIRTSASYMPCLNGEHAYLVGDLQKELYQIALVRLKAEAGKPDDKLVNDIAQALTSENQEEALAALLTEENNAVAAAETALDEANSALSAAEEAHSRLADDVTKAYGAVTTAETALEEAKASLAEEAKAITDAQSAVSSAQAEKTAAEEALNNAQEEAEINEAQSALDAANAALVAANAALTDATAAYNEAYSANETITAAELSLNDARTAYDEAVAAEQTAAAAANEARTAAETAATSLEKAKTALKEKKALIKVNEIESKLAGEQVAADIYITPHDGDLEYTVFNQWGATGNEKAVRKMVKAGKFVNGSPANIEIPDILTDDDVYLALMSDWDSVKLNAKGYLNFTTNYSATKKEHCRKGWNPDSTHCYFTAGSYVLIDHPVNEDTVAEESKPYASSDKLYSYWSPDYDNEYGCFDRMIIEKQGAVTLAKQILNSDPGNNRVAYVGFTYGAYPSLSSFGLGDNGFCDLYDNDLDEMLSIMENTNGHDYTNYVHALYMARKIISMREDQERPCYVLFISDGVPTQSKIFDNKPLVDAGGWNVLSNANGDFPWFDDVFNKSDTHVEAANKMAGYIKEYLGETTGDSTKFYTVGFSTNEAASNLLQSMASDENSFFNCSTVDEFMEKMDAVIDDIMTHYPSGSLTDVIGEDFNLLVDQDHPFIFDNSRYTSLDAAVAAGGVAVEGKTLSWNLKDVDETGVQISFYVKLTDEELNKFEDGSTRIYNTNADSMEATGANLIYHKLIVDSTKSTGYYAEDEITSVPLKTPQLTIWNEEVKPGDNNNDNNDGNNDNQGGSDGENPGHGGSNVVIPNGDGSDVEKPEEDSKVEEPKEEDPKAEEPKKEDPKAEKPKEKDPLSYISGGDNPFGANANQKAPEDKLNEDIPLSGVPKTGDPFMIWMFLSAFCGICLIILNVMNYKSQDEK